jgi:hypothetical protein
MTGYITVDVETILGRERRPFDANQANYHLEGGLRSRAERHLLIPFFHHISRHLVDRPKTQLVDWNLLGLRAAGSRPPRLARRLRHRQRRETQPAGLLPGAALAIARPCLPGLPRHRLSSPAAP